MSYLQALILSVIEGTTEFLPISSTGHLILASKILSISQTDFAKTFEIVIQAGAILAVAALYIKKLMRDKKLLLKTFFAFLPTAILGLFFYKMIKNYLLGNIAVTVLSLFIGGIAIIILEKYFKTHKTVKSINNLTIKQFFCIGLFQSISMIPGVSRSAATIFGGMIVGLKREDAIRFSFILAIPTMFAATGLDLLKSISSFNIQNIKILIFGLVVSFVVALVVVKWFLGFIKKNNLTWFGVYRIILAMLFFLLVK